MSSAPWPVLFEDNHLLVVNKPAGLPTMGVADDRPSLINQAKEYIRNKFRKPGNVYLGIVSRLDAPVTGVIVLARTSKAASRLTAQFRAGEVEKTYRCCVSGRPRPPAGRLVDFVRKDERHRKMHIASATTPSAKEARLEYRTMREIAGGAMLEIRLETGRKHQIRLQLSHFGHPIFGDRKYGSRMAMESGIALHAHRVKLLHPVRREWLEIEADVPASWRPLGF